MVRTAVFSLPPEEVARVVTPAQRRRGLFKKLPVTPQAGPLTRAFELHDGSLLEIPPDREILPESEVLLITARSFPLAFPGAALLTAGGHRWDLVLEGEWRVGRAQDLHREFAGAWLTPDTPLLRGTLEGWFHGRLRDFCREAAERAVSEHGADAVLSGDAFPLRRWQKECERFLSDLGLDVRIERAAFASPSAAREAQEAEERTRRQAEAHAREEEIRAERRVAELHEQGDRAAAEATVKLAQLRRAQEQDRWEHEVRIAGLRAAVAREDAERARAAADVITDEEERKRRLQRIAEQQRAAQDEIAALAARREEVREALARERGALTELAAGAELLQRVYRLLGDGDYQDLARLAAEQDASPSTLAALATGLSGSRLYAHLPPNLRRWLELESFVEAIREKAAQDGPSVRLVKQELTSREIGSGSRRRKRSFLSIGESLRLSVETDCDGHLTLLNPSTRGRLVAHVPAAGISPTATRVFAGDPVSIPGGAGLAWNLVEDYREEGPPGWEHLVALVTPEPVLEAPPERECAETFPFWVVSDRAMHELCERLAGLPSESWAAGILTFCVE